MRLACLSHFRWCSITLAQLRWVQSGYKIRVSSGNATARFESSTLGRTEYYANQPPEFTGSTVMPKYAVDGNGSVVAQTFQCSP